MAPMRRNNAPSAGIDAPTEGRQVSREVSWQIVESETQSERAVSEEPVSSYDEEADYMPGNGEGKDYEKQEYLEGPEDHEDILHPLREAANRVGREVERFAEVLDGYNPLRATEKSERHDMTFDLIELYHNIALETLDRLREQHATDQRVSKGRSWRKKMRGFKIAREDEDIDVEDAEEQEYRLANPQTTIQDMDRWEQEAQTWDLLRRLVHLRFPASGSDDDLSKPADTRARLHRYSTQQEAWEKFLETDSIALERKTVLKWLKDTAEESGEDISILVQDLQQNAERGDIIAHGWLHTKAAIKNQKRLHTWPQVLDPSSPEVQRVHLNSSKTEPLVTQLDPDAATRQGRKLETQDEYFERAIWLGCYEMLRRGRSSDEIREWCKDRTEIWRAVSMSGLPDTEPEDSDETEDPASVVLWRRMCFALARNGGGDDYERAVYGILSGDIPSVEPVLKSWDDFVFVHYNALLRSQFDDFLRKLQPGVPTMATNLSVFDAVQFHGDAKSAGAKLIQTLKGDQRIAEETLHPLKMLQGVLIADGFVEFIYQQGLALSKFANANGASNLIPVTVEQPENEAINKYIALDDHDSLRVLTHVLLVFLSLGVDMGGAYRQSIIENVIVAYISFLRLAGKEEIIPLYCSQLSGARRYATLSRNLIDVTNHEQRVMQINLMRDLGLDVQEFVKFQSRYLFADYTDKSEGYPATGNFHLMEEDPESGVKKIRKDFFGDDPERVERVDMLFIRSLEWYLLVDGLWSETFLVGTMLYLRFFKNLHLPAARMLASRVPSSDIARRKTHAVLGQSLDFTGLEAGDDEDLTEVLDGTAERKRLLRRHMIAEAKNFRELETLTETLDNIETISSMETLITENASREWQKGWQQQLAKAFIPTRNTAQPLLRGWLLTTQQEDAEFQLLREAYLPETILAFIATLQYGGTTLTRDFLLECMELSALVAEDGSDLLDLFTRTGRLKELVEAFTQASKTLLITSTSKKRGAARTKKMKTRGWTQELWTVKP